MSAQYDVNRQERAVADYFSGLSVARIAMDLRVSKSTIYTWIRKQKAEGLIRTVSTQKQLMNLKQKLTKLQDIVSVLRTVDCLPNAPLRERLIAAELLYGKYSVYVLCDALNIARGTLGVC